MMKTGLLILSVAFLVGCGTVSRQPSKVSTAVPTPSDITKAELEDAIQLYHVFVKEQASGNAPNPLTSNQIRIIQQYQMDVFRAIGMKGPPLPMVLTPEMDAQLVKEGLLPPRDKKK
jgi:hypothetical protein